jgi:hypothetical protein
MDISKKIRIMRETITGSNAWRKQHLATFSVNVNVPTEYGRGTTEVWHGFPTLEAAQEWAKSKAGVRMATEIYNRYKEMYGQGWNE